MYVNQNPRKVIVNLPQNGSQAIGRAEGYRPSASCSETKIPPSHSTQVGQGSPAYEIPVKAQSIPDVRLDSKEDNGSASPGSTGEKTNDTLIPLRRTDSPGQKQGTLMSWLKPSKSIGNLKTDTTRDTGTDTKRAVATDTEKDRDTTTETNSRTATNPASEQVFNLPGAAGCFTFRAPSPLNGAPSAVKQPALNQDVRPLFDFLKTASPPNPSTATLLEDAHLVRLSNGTPQHHGPTAVPSVNRSVSKPRAGLSLFRDSEASPSVDFSDRNFHSDPSPLHSGQAAPPSGIFDWKATLDPLRLGNTACGDAAPSGLLAEGKTTNRPFQPEIPVRPAESDRTQSMSALRAEKQGSQHPNTHQLLSPTSNAFLGHNSAQSTVPSSPVPRRRLPGPDADEHSNDSQTHHSASSSTGRNTPVPNASLRTPGSVEDNDCFGSSPPFKKDSDSEDYSLALIRSPSPGSLDVIWNWTITELRTQMSQAFFCIAKQLCQDLKPKDMSDDYIYAFKVKDPQGGGYVKIGVASNIKSRMKTHEKCYGECERIYPPQGEKFVRVDHAYRVERLIHAELVERGMLLMLCPRDRQNHNCHGEWFEVEERHAIAVIRKWSEWMSSSPYEEKPLIKSNQRKTPSRKSASRKSLEAKSPNGKSPKASPTTKWGLKIQERNIMMKICWPLDPFATMRDDGGIDEVGTSIRLMSVS
jgi:hypothetical protein